MQKKQSEDDFSALMLRIGWWARKQADRRRPSCPICHRELNPCPYCKGDTLLPKAKTLPDFLAAPATWYIECKQGNGSWELTDFSPIQTELLDGKTSDDPHKAWLFLLMSDGRGTRVDRGGRMAWLIPWNEFRVIRSEVLLNGFKSVRYENTARSKLPLAKDLFGEYALTWNKGGWEIPNEHCWNPILA